MHVLRIAEGRREGDPPAADAVVQALQVVAVVVGQRGPVAGVGRFSTFIISAASATLIVCGPRWATLPIGESG
jgi:hypothetical protein